MLPFGHALSASLRALRRGKQKGNSPFGIRLCRSCPKGARGKLLPSGPSGIVKYFFLTESDGPFGQYKEGSLLCMLWAVVPEAKA